MTRAVKVSEIIIHKVTKVKMIKSTGSAPGEEYICQRLLIEQIHNGKLVYTEVTLFAEDTKNGIMFTDKPEV